MQQVMRYKKVSGGEGCSDIMAVRPDGRWIKSQDYDALAATVIEQQAEIERLREAAKRLLDNYGFCSDGSDHYREVPVEDIEALSAALGATQ